MLRAVAELGDQAPTVVMTGAIQDTRWPEYRAEVEALLKQPDVASKVIVTGQISREEQLGILFGAHALVQPSLFEGWSSFVEEGRATGKAIILSDIPVHREQHPPGSVFFQAEDIGQLAAALADWQNLPQQSLQEARARHRDFSAECARQFLQLVELVQTHWQSRHDPKVIAADQLAELDERVDQDIKQTDFDLFAAGVRQLFRDYPEDLARLSHLICQPDHPYADRAAANILLATMRKAEDTFTQRYFAHDPWQDGWFDTLQADNQGDLPTLSRTRHLTLRSALMSRELFNNMRATLKRKLNIE